jgi:transcriptional regulator with XRE-family HTH domain
MNKIKFYRQEMGLTVRSLADKSNIAAGYLSTLENDESDSINPTKCVMEKISAALEKTVPNVFFPKIRDKTTEKTEEAN